jgi:biflaviolin synthase
VTSGIRIGAGEPVFVSYLAANRDQDVFADPDGIDVDRAANPHLAFGNGAHYCTGAVLARLQTELLVGTPLVEWRRRTMIRGPRTLPCTW